MKHLKLVKVYWAKYYIILYNIFGCLDNCSGNQGRYERGVFRPIDYVEFREGEELEVMIIRKSFRGFQKEGGRYLFEIDRDVVKEFIMERR